jgi:CDP-glycerol glycerophosphotransferase (TagB/SpsB family)
MFYQKLWKKNLMKNNRVFEIPRRAWYSFIRWILVPLSYLVRKKRNIWVYYPAHFKTLAGDCLFLFDYIYANDPSISQYILIDKHFRVSNSKFLDQAVDRYSIRGIILSLVAKVIIIDADGPFKNGRFNVVQLWHGTGYKNIIALSGKYSLEYNKKRLKNICFVSSSSESDRERKIKSFLTEKVYITGSPRNDFFFSSEAKSLLEALRSRLNIENSTKVILYAPTYRSSETFKPLSSSFFESLQKICKKNNLVFLIKRHPKDKTVYSLHDYKNIRDITSAIQEVQELLLLSDMLITDYSSIASDFALLSRPIIFYTYDFEHYTHSQRGFYYNLNEVLPGPFANSESDLLNLINNTSWFMEVDYQHKFRVYQDIFHSYKDGNSSKRVYTQLLEEINNIV